MKTMANHDSAAVNPDRVLQLQSMQARVSSSLLLEDLDFTLDSGQVLTIVGPNGAGKTSLLRVLCGELALQQGELEFNGRPMTAWPAAERAKLLAVLPQRSLLDFPFLVSEVVSLGRIPHSSASAENADIVERALMLVDCSHLKDRHYINLSGGEKQRVQLARVAAQIWHEGGAAKGRCLILDEPTSNLDLAHQAMLECYLQHFSEQGVSILMVLHDLNLAMKWSDRILVVDQGGRAAEGEPEKVLTPALLQQVFGVQAQIMANPLTQKPMVAL